MRRVNAKFPSGAEWYGPGIALLPELSQRLHAGESPTVKVDGVPVTLAQIDAVLARCAIPSGEHVEPSEADWMAAGVQ